MTLLARNELYIVTFSELYLEEFIRGICKDEDVIAYAITHQNGKVSKGWRDAIDEYCEYIADIIAREIEIKGESSYKGYTIIQTED